MSRFHEHQEISWQVETLPPLEIGYGVQSEKMLHEEYLEKETNRCLNHHDAEGREERFFLPFTNILLALC